MAVLFYTFGPVNQRVDLKDPAEIRAKNHVSNLFPKGLCKTSVHLGRTNDMLSLFSLLADFNHDFNINVFRFQGVKFQMNLINQVYDPVVAVFQGL